MSVSFAYITVSSKEEALRIGRTIVEERLAACANVLDSVTSIYRWQGSVNEEPEVVLIAKTRTELVERLTTRVVELHSYECPCVVSWPIASGPVPYLKWISDEMEGTSA